ncbi:MAG: AraC family transcriptional regulator [Pyrinomonadaceae bacterium]
MYYRELEAPQYLRNLVLSFWEFAVPETVPPFQQEIFPDGCVSVICVRNQRAGVHVVGLSGLHLQTVSKPMTPGDSVWGMRISPAALLSVLGEDPKKMIDTSFFGADANPALLAGLAEEMAAVIDLEEAVSVFESRIRDIAAGPHAADQLVAAAVRIIEENRGEIRVGELSRQLGLSTRQFQRRFKQSAGLSPKQYIRARRIRAAAIDIIRDSAPNWAERAASLGFADQSHLSREVVSLTNRSPNSFAENVSKIEHGHIIE